VPKDDIGQHDRTGKVSFDHVYSRTDPRAYFHTLRQFEYAIPEAARPHFANLVAEYRQARNVNAPRILDVGCSYGVNAALLRCDTTLSELYERYDSDEAAGRSRPELLAADRDFVRARDLQFPAWFVGLDASAAALDYAVAAGYLDEGVPADLELCEPNDTQREQLAGTDLVISTGCIGYITEKTLRRIVEATGRRRPWMAHLCLRMFPYDTIAGQLDDLGYETVRLEKPFRQRRFASDRERALVLDRLSELGIDPAGLESGGWFYAELYISRPKREG
jgi:SAM-dependent methyltransferase